MAQQQPLPPKQGPVPLSTATINLSANLYCPTWQPGESRPILSPLKQRCKTSLRSVPGELSNPPGLVSGAGDGFSEGMYRVPPSVPRTRNKVPQELDTGLTVTRPTIATADQKLASAQHNSVYLDLDRRRDLRSTRSRPWTEKSDLPIKPRANESITVEVHYGASLPPETWVKSEPRKYTKNIKYGEAFMLKKVKGQPVAPANAEWLQDDAFRTWLLEKSPNTKMGIDVDKVVVGEKSKKRQHAKTKTKEPETDDYNSEKELYQRYLKEKETREGIERSAVTFQKHVRGWLERKSMKNLQLNVILESGTSFKELIKDYRGLMSRINMRNGRKPSAPFTIDMANDYLERKKRYNGVFNGYAVRDHLPVPKLDKFVLDCGIEINDDSLEYTFNTVFEVCTSRADVVLLIDLPVSLGDGNFKSQQVFLKDIVECLHISSTNIRIGYIPFKSDVFVGFELGQCKTREAVMKGLDKVRYHKGTERTDLALRKMRNTFKRARVDGMEVPRIAVMLSEGGDFITRVLERQAREAREKDNIQMFGIGNTDKIGELVAVTGHPSRVFHVPHHSAVMGVRAKLMELTGIQNCRHCEWRQYQVAGLEEGRGLSRLEAMELLFQMAPPGSVSKKSATTKVHAGRPFRFNDDEDELLPKDDGNAALFDPCLRFVIKSRLEHEGQVSLPAGGDTERDVTVTSWREAMKRAEEFSEREEAQKDMEEEKDARTGYRDNVIRNAGLDDDVSDMGDMDDDITDSDENSQDEEEPTKPAEAPQEEEPKGGSPTQQEG